MGERALYIRMARYADDLGCGIYPRHRRRAGRRGRRLSLADRL
jgi:hypothetical protein